ncbi:hypothetical protein FRUB_10564 [Fimbriiglobus ruber]|uniref:Uncharacterized protein n=1 Tax=Fimbriiglobus ruber TaxID=1908690 RepID=A0A225D0Y4_9BACT|nr:hypothetical protein FRUB_10564 [Fimbriiglobus ruber]
MGPRPHLLAQRLHPKAAVSAREIRRNTGRTLSTCKTR